MKYLTILGSTGSIGTSTLSVIKQHPDKFRVSALVSKKNVKLMTEQCRIFRPDYVCMINKQASHILKRNLILDGIKVNVLSGVKSACELASLDSVDIVMSAIVGTAGLLPTLSALRSGKRVLLANKESLVTCGRLFMNEVRNNKAHLLPVDSEHNAIFQSLPEELQRCLGYSSLKEYGVLRIILTASGGPFYQTPLSKLSTVTPDQACFHPNWDMGRKISVDSATMMNKGLEYIEARWLFNASSKQIEVLIHPQSVMHSMVCYIDGSILAQLGSPDMRISISHAMAYPNRVISGVKQIDFLNMEKLSFSKPDNKRYPCLQLAIDASNHGQAATTVLNAANEIAVTSFLRREILFTDIEYVNSYVLEKLVVLKEPDSIEEVLSIDRQARKEAKCKVLSISR